MASPPSPLGCWGLLLLFSAHLAAADHYDVRWPDNFGQPWSRFLSCSPLTKSIDNNVLHMKRLTHTRCKCVCPNPSVVNATHTERKLYIKNVPPRFGNIWRYIILQPEYYIQVIVFLGRGGEGWFSLFFIFFNKNCLWVLLSHCNCPNVVIVEEGLSETDTDAFCPRCVCR